MKMLGVSGSPKGKGCANRLLDNALAGAGRAGWSTEMLVLNDLDFRPCQGCGSCLTIGACAVRDDMQVVFKKFKSADAVIIASPIFFGSVSAQLKMMIDRFNCVWVSRHILRRRYSRDRRRKGAFLCVAEQKRLAHFKNAEDILKNFFATVEIDYVKGLFFEGCDMKEERKNGEAIALGQARKLGLSLCNCL